MDQELKQRVIGVTVIVALAVIFVPMLFDKREDRQRAAGGIPPIPEHVMETNLELPKSAEDLAPKEEQQTAGPSGYKVIPITEVPAEKPASESKADSRHEISALEALAEPGAEQEEFGVAEDKAAKTPAEKPHRDEITKPVAAPAEKPAKPIAVEKPVETVKKSKAADSVVKKPESVAPVSVPPKPEVTLPVVKKPKPVEAPATANTSKPETPAMAPVVKPAAPKPAVSVQPRPPIAEVTKPQPLTSPQPVVKPAPEAPVAAEPWVVQAGSFTNESKAKALADKLRQAKLPAFVESAASERGVTYRVQVGPELDRARAEDIQKQVEASSGIKGIIVPHR
jgi:DedD protein